MKAPAHTHNLAAAVRFGRTWFLKCYPGPLYLQSASYCFKVQSLCRPSNTLRETHPWPVLHAAYRLRAASPARFTSLLTHATHPADTLQDRKCPLGSNGPPDTPRKCKAPLRPRSTAWDPSRRAYRNNPPRTRRPKSQGPSSCRPFRPDKGCSTSGRALQ